MNELFARAQELHKVIRSSKEDVVFDEDMAVHIVQASSYYASALMSALHAGSVDTVTELYHELYLRDLLVDDMTWEMCMALDVLTSPNRSLASIDVIKAYPVYMKFRKCVLSTFEKISPPYYRDGFCYHDILGVKIPSKDFAWKLDLECFYTDWLVSA